MFKVKAKNLQPWLDYFRLLQTYEEKGFLQTEPEKHEAYVTLPALCTLSEDNAVLEMKVLRRIRAYAGWQSRTGRDYLDRPFAVHVVKGEAPHDLVATLLLSRKRHWWWPLWKLDSFETITYG